MENMLETTFPMVEKIIDCEKNIEVSKELKEIPFGAAVASWIEVAREELKEKMPQVPIMVSKGAIRALERELIERFSRLATPVFVLEMHITKMQKGLNGETPEARYEDYVHRFLGDADYLREFFDEYRALQERIEVALTLWVKKAAVFYERVETDYDELQKKFGVLGQLEDIKLGLSDPHNGNQSVYELIFESGISIFYKPKSMRIDVVFNEFLLEMNSKELSPELKAYQTWDRTSYGWVEKIEHLPCQDEKEVEAYFTRAGMLLCLCYLFEGTDVHHENLIANGPYPALVDVETLFHPNLSTKQLLDSPTEWKNSVLRVGMLPNFMMGEKGLAGVDISALGGAEGQKAPSFSPRWDHVNTDEMCMAYFLPTISASKNLVRLGDKICVARDYLDAIVTGFKTLYGFIKERRALLLEDGGWLDRFAKCPVRCVCRPTRLYFKLLEQLLDPKHLRGKEGHEEILDILPRYMLENGNEHLAPVVTEEQRAMEQGDIPFFQTLPKSKDLYLNGKVIVEDVLEGFTYDGSKELIKEMSDETCSEQIDLIEQSFYALDYTSIETKNESKRVEKSAASIAVTDAVLLEEAVKLGHLLLNKGRRNRKGRLSWIALEFLPEEEQMQFTSLNQNLYGGTFGLSLVFGALYQVTKDPFWKETTDASLQQLLESIDGDGVERMPGVYGLGGMTGLGSMIYSLGHIAELTKEPKYIEKALFLTTLIKDKHIEEDQKFDVIFGVAGCILALLSLYKKTPEASLLALAQKMGDHLVNSAHPEETGVSWPTKGSQGLLGFSHGTAGIAFALDNLAMASGKDSYLKTADQAIAYERSHFSKEARNWPHLGMEDASSFPCAWCHGAPGIGLARICSPRLAKSPEMLEEVAHATFSTKATFTNTGQHHLCCGDLGRAEILSTIAKHTGDAALGKYARERISALVQQTRTNRNYNLFSALPAGAFIPGFMQGLSGIGYTFLRYTKDGKDLPNVLILE